MEKETIELEEADIELYWAAVDGDLARVQAAVAAGANIDSRHGEHEWTPLFQAARMGHLAVTEFLVEAGADFKSVVGSGSSPFHEAVYSSNVEIVSYLLRQGVDVESANALTHYSALQMAALYAWGGLEKRKLVLEELLRAGADINKRNEELEGATALMLAAERAAQTGMVGDVEMLQFLIESGGDLGIVDEAGRRAIDYAKEGMGREMVRAYLESMGREQNDE